MWKSPLSLSSNLIIKMSYPSNLILQFNQSFEKITHQWISLEHFALPGWTSHLWDREKKTPLLGSDMTLFLWEPHKERTGQALWWQHSVFSTHGPIGETPARCASSGLRGASPFLSMAGLQENDHFLCYSRINQPFSFVNCWLVLGCLQRMIHFSTHRWFYWGKRIIGCGLETGGILWGQGLTFQPFQFFAQGNLNCPRAVWQWMIAFFVVNAFVVWTVNPFRFDANGLFRIIMNYSMFWEGLNTPSTHWPLALVWNAVLHVLHKYPMVYQYFPNYNIIKK